MTIEIPDTLTLTGELKAALLKTLGTILYNYYGESGFNHQVEIDKIELADALLVALSLPPAPPLPTAESSSVAIIAQRRRTTMPFEKRARIVARDGFKCVRCGSENGLEVDHKLPVAKGGTDNEENLQTLCGTCNRQKGARVPEV